MYNYPIKHRRRVYELSSLSAVSAVFQSAVYTTVRAYKAHRAILRRYSIKYPLRKKNGLKAQIKRLERTLYGKKAYTEFQELERGRIVACRNHSAREGTQSKVACCVGCHVRNFDYHKWGVAFRRIHKIALTFCGTNSII